MLVRTEWTTADMFSTEALTHMFSYQQSGYSRGKFGEIQGKLARENWVGGGESQKSMEICGPRSDNIFHKASVFPLAGSEISQGKSAATGVTKFSSEPQPLSWQDRKSIEEKCSYRSDKFFLRAATFLSVGSEI